MQCTGLLKKGVAMDFDSIVTVIIIASFFIFPSILRQLRGRKEKAKPAKKKKPSFFNKIQGQIQNFITELEQQAQQQKAQKKEGTFWDTLTEDSGEEYKTESLEEERYDLRVSSLEPSLETIERTADITPAQSKNKPMAHSMPEIRSHPRKFNYRRHPLQNAIVLSEILSRPVALRKEPANSSS